MFWIIYVILVASWIYLVWMVRKKKTELAESRLKRLKKFLLIGGISLAGLVVFFIGVGVYHAIWGLPEEENSNPVVFWIGASLLWVFIIASIGSWIIFFTGRRKTT